MDPSQIMAQNVGNIIQQQQQQQQQYQQDTAARRMSVVLMGQQRQQQLQKEDATITADMSVYTFPMQQQIAIVVTPPSACNHGDQVSVTKRWISIVTHWHNGSQYCNQ